MILGFNTDTRYKGRTFHIQTEDSGPGNPVIITHLFTGGVILVTRRREYADALGRDDLAAHVRGLMRTQHREVQEALVRGEFDEVIRRPPRAELPQIPKKAPVAPAPTPPPSPRDTHDREVDDISLIESIELVDDPDAGEGTPPRVGFPTDLVSDAMLDEGVLAYLTEDLDDK
jgi:hypothetical protein